MVNPKARLGYMYGINASNSPYEAPNKTNDEKFQSVVGEQGAYYAVGARIPRKRARMAGDVLNLDLTQSTGNLANVPLPEIGAAEMRTQ
jgi:hypothetical protein